MTALRLVRGLASPAPASRTGALIRFHAAEELRDEAWFAEFDADTDAERALAKAKRAAAEERLRIAEARLWRIDADLAGQRWLEVLRG